MQRAGSMHPPRCTAQGRAKGGPHGEDKKEAWNFMPLCADCNLDMKTQNAIDWFYEVCKSNHNFKPLFEMLYRLWRARCQNIEGAASLPADLRMNSDEVDVRRTFLRSPHPHISNSSFLASR